jgi:hypothetical protein
MTRSDSHNPNPRGPDAPRFSLPLKEVRVSTKTFVIDGSDPKHFALAVNDGILQVGDTPTHPEGIARDLRVVRIHCEVEIEDGRDNLPIDQPGILDGGALGPAGLQLPHAQLALRDTQDVPAAAPPPPAPAADAGLISLDLDEAGPRTTVDAPARPPAPAPAPPAPRRFKVIDGGDQGRSFRLPDVGTVTLGKPGYATIGLNDLYVMRVHCSLEIDPRSILVTHVEGQNGTLIDAQRIAGPTRLRPGSVLRIGNSHLKLEVGPFDDEAKVGDPWLGEERPRVRLQSGSSGEVPAIGKSGVLRVPESGEKPSNGDDGEVMRAEPQEPEALDVALVEDDTLEGLNGQTLGHYEIGEMLGRGLSGAVYQAVDTKTGQAVALKVFPAGFPASAAELERVVREFKTVQQIRHPNLVTPLGAGKSGPHFWISRELVEGVSAAGLIAAIAEGEKPSWTRTARVTIHLARLLDWLHQQGVIHGNITPRNVLLRQADRTTKLADLRLAQALEGSRLQQSVRGKKLLADLPYLAPEQAEPGAVVDNLADLYAVGAVAYALLTGRPPATGATPEEIRKEVRKGRPPRPSSVYKKVPPEFDGTVMRLLARYREDRFPTAGALLADLDLLAQSHDLKV